MLNSWILLAALAVAPSHTQAAPEVIGVFEGDLVHLVPANYPIFHIRMMFSADHNFTETHTSYQVKTPLGPVVLTSSMGTWQAATGGGSHAYVIELAHNVEHGPGAGALSAEAIGVNRVEWNPLYDPATDTVSGPWVARLFDAKGDFMAETSGTITAARMLPMRKTPMHAVN